MKINEKTLAVKISNEFNISMDKAKSIAKFILQTQTDCLKDGGSVVFRGLCTVEGDLTPPKKKLVFGKMTSIAEKLKVKVKMSRAFQQKENSTVDNEILNLVDSLTKSE